MPALRPVCGTFQKTGFRLRLIVCACLPACLTCWLLLLLLACTSCCCCWCCCCFVGLLGFFFVVVFKLYLLCLCCAFDFVTHFLCWFRCRCDVAVAVAAMWLLILMLFFSLMEFMLLCPFRQRLLCSLLVCSVAATRFFECINAHTLLLLFLLLFLLSALLLLLLAALFFFNSWEFGSFFCYFGQGKRSGVWK